MREARDTHQAVDQMYAAARGQHEAAVASRKTAAIAHALGEIGFDVYAQALATETAVFQLIRDLRDALPDLKIAAAKEQRDEDERPERERRAKDLAEREAREAAIYAHPRNAIRIVDETFLEKWRRLNGRLCPPRRRGILDKESVIAIPDGVIVKGGEGEPEWLCMDEDALKAWAADCYEDLIATFMRREKFIDRAQKLGKFGGIETAGRPGWVNRDAYPIGR